MKKRILKTITLGEDPHAVICPGHVDQKTFNKAHKAEGWSVGSYRQKDLKYIYMVKEKPRSKKYLSYYKQVPPTAKGAKPFTWTPWD